MSPYRSTPLGSADTRYLNDVTFRAMVDTMINVIESLQLTPSEVREAAMYACILIEERRPTHAFAGNLVGEPRHRDGDAANPGDRRDAGHRG